MAQSSSMHSADWMLEKGAVLGQTFWANAHVILPPLVMYILHGPYSLRIWAAARHLSALSAPKLAVSKPDTKKPVTKAFASGLVSFFELFVLESVLPIGVCYAITSLLRPEFSFIYTVVASICFDILLTYVKVALLTHFSGRMLVVQRVPPFFVGVCAVQKRKYSYVLISAAAAVVCFFAIIYDSTICLVLVYVATLRLVGDMHVQPVQSIRNITIGTLGVIAFITVLNIFFLVYPEKAMIEIEDNSSALKVYLALLKFGGIFAPMFAAACPQALISLCYRFDKSNSILSSTNPDPESSTFFIETFPIGPIVAVPKTLSKKFPKSYFIAAISAWFITNELMLILVAFNWIQLPEEPIFGFGVVTGGVAMPVILLTIAGLAAARGELKTMWIYKEEWGVAPIVPEGLDNSGSPVAKTLLDETKIFEKA